MSQEINEVGVLKVTSEKNVIFNKRIIRNIYISENEICTIEMCKKSDEGELIQTINIPSSIFLKEIEGIIWKLVDQAQEKEK